MSGVVSVFYTMISPRVGRLENVPALCRTIIAHFPPFFRHTLLVDRDSPKAFGASMSTPAPCVFCEIVAGTAPASVVHEDELSLVIMTIGPVNPGHVLVLSKVHAPGLADLDETTGMHLFRIAMRTAAAIRASSVRCEGINLFLADGEAAFQEVFHVHLHVFPRFAEDGFGISADWSVMPSREELDHVAAQIRQAYGAAAP
jgi:histidine triad (HIT) family protein